MGKRSCVRISLSCIHTYVLLWSQEGKKKFGSVCLVSCHFPRRLLLRMMCDNKIRPKVNNAKTLHERLAEERMPVKMVRKVHSMIFVR
jgi:hypothetical protein